MKQLFSYLILSAFTTSTTAWAGLPPTTIQGQSDATAKTKFGFQVPYSQSTDLGGIKALIETGNQNLLVNASFENTSSAAGWTITTAAGAVETSTISAGKQSEKLTFTASTGDIAQSVTPTVQTLGQNIEASCAVNTTLSTIQVCALSGGTEIQCSNAPASGNFARTAVNIPGPANGTSIGVRVKTSSSTTGVVYVDDCYVGAARNLGSGAYASDWQTYTPTFTGFGTVAVSSALWRRVGDSVEVSGSFTAGTTTGVNAQISLPSSCPAWDTTKINGNQRATLGTFIRANASNTAIPVSGFGPWVATADSATSTSSVQFSNTSNNAGGIVYGIAFGNQLLASGETASFQFKVPCSGWTSNGAAFRPEQTPASWSGYHTVASGWSEGSTTYADFGAGTTVVLNESTNRNFGTVSTAASSLPGITFTPPRAGLYYICAEPNILSSGASTDSLRLVDGSGTILNRGKSFTFPAGTVQGSMSICGEYLATTAATTIKLQGATNTATFTIDNGTATGSGAIQWSIVELDAPMPAPYLTGSVTSFSPGSERWEHASIANNGTASFTPSNSTAWISSVSRTGAGTVAITVNSGVFSAAPDCVCVRNSSATGECSSTSASATSVTAYLANSAGTGTDLPFFIHCAGPK